MHLHGKRNFLRPKIFVHLKPAGASKQNMPTFPRHPPIRTSRSVARSMTSIQFLVNKESNALEEKQLDPSSYNSNILGIVYIFKFPSHGHKNDSVVVRRIKNILVYWRRPHARTAVVVIIISCKARKWENWNLQALPSSDVLNYFQLKGYCF
jgi:hypothetical protein